MTEVALRSDDPLQSRWVPDCDGKADGLDDAFSHALSLPADRNGKGGGMAGQGRAGQAGLAAPLFIFSCAFIRSPHFEAELTCILVFFISDARLARGKDLLISGSDIKALWACVSLGIYPSTWLHRHRHHLSKVFVGKFQKQRIRAVWFGFGGGVVCVCAFTSFRSWSCCG